MKPHLEIIETVVRPAHTRHHSCNHPDLYDCCCESHVVPERVKVRLRFVGPEHSLEPIGHQWTLGEAWRLAEYLISHNRIA